MHNHKRFLLNKLESAVEFEVFNKKKEEFRSSSVVSPKQNKSKEFGELSALGQALWKLEHIPLTTKAPKVHRLKSDNKAEDQASVRY